MAGIVDPIAFLESLPEETGGRKGALEALRRVKALGVEPVLEGLNPSEADRVRIRLPGARLLLDPLRLDGIQLVIYGGGLLLLDKTGARKVQVEPGKLACRGLEKPWART